jgi:peptide maturation system protein (TIGR04066 family)
MQESAIRLLPLIEIKSNIERSRRVGVHMKSFINRKIVLYPFSDQTYGLTSLLLDKNIEIIPTVSSGSSYIGNTIGYAVNRKDDRASIKDVTIIDEVLVDCVFLSGQTNFDLHYKNIEYICKRCASKGMILIYQGVDKKTLELIELYCKPNHYLELLRNNIEIDIQRDKEDCSFVDINIPVIYVGGLIESNDSFENSIMLKNAFEQLGYCGLVVSSNRDIEIVEGYVVPDFFMTTQYLPEEQLSKMVTWFTAIINMKHPDVIIVDLPKGLLTYNKRINNTFGIYSIMLSLILNPDFLIVSVNNYELTENELYKYNNYFMKRLGKEVDVFHLSNRYFKVYDADYSVPTRPLFIKHNKLTNFIDSFNLDSTIKLMDLASNENINVVRDKIIEKFSKDEE